MINAIIVDDEYLILEGLKILIDWEKLGVRIIADACDGANALEIIKQLKPHLVITDISMPALSGIELMKSLKQQDVNPIFIILSGYDDFNYAQDAIKLGAFRYLLKPIQAEELEQCISEAVSLVKQKCKEEGIINKFKQIVGDKVFQEVENTNEGETIIANGKRITNNSIMKVIGYIQEHIESNLNLDELANVIFVHPNYLSSMFKNEMGENIVDYIARMRVEKAKQLLSAKDIKAYEVAGKIGYKDSRYFSQVFKKYTGLTPFEYKSQKTKRIKGVV